MGSGVKLTGPDVAFVVAITAVLVGAAVQRATGIGFALVATPVLGLAYGSSVGVLTSNLLGAIMTLAVTLGVARKVEWARAVPLMMAACLGIPVGVLLMRTLPESFTQLIVGVLVIIALTYSALAGERIRIPRAMQWPAGAVSGALSASFGIPGPVLAVYAIGSGWDARSFAVSVQPVFFVTAAAAFCAKIATGSAHLPPLGSLGWLILALSLALGTVAGIGVARWIPPRVASIALFVVATAGAVVSIVDAVIGLSR